MNYISYIIGFVLLLLLFFEITVISFVTEHIPLLNDVGMVRYHTQRALDCYISVLQENIPPLFDTAMCLTTVTNSSECLQVSQSFINIFAQYEHLQHLHLASYVFAQIFDLKKSKVVKNINLYLPDINLLNSTIYTNIDAMRDFIATQYNLQLVIVKEVSEYIMEESTTLITLYIINYILLFMFMITTFIYIYTTNRTKQRRYKMNVEKSVINQLCHELRTSLTPIEMYSRELLHNLNTDFEQKQFINNYILGSLKQHEYILNSRLDFEKILSNEYVLHLENVDIILTLKILIKEIEQYIVLSNKPLKIKLYSCIESLYIRIDKLVFHYIITNILRNSVKYSNNGKITIFVCFSERNLNIQIEDESIGLTNEIMNKLNESSNKLSIVHTKSGDSYGLGVRFTKKLTSILKNGYYYIQRTDNGSLTTVSFDADMADNEYIEERRANQGEYNFCIADDCPIVRNVMKRTIKSIFKDVQILEFNNGEQVLDYTFDSDKTYIHILDQNMQSTGGQLLGHEIAVRLKSMDALRHYTISMSGNELNAGQIVPFDLMWPKPPPSNDIIETQIRGLMRTSPNYSIDSNVSNIVIKRQSADLSECSSDSL